MSNAVITGTGLLSVAGIGAGRVVQAMTSHANLFDGPMTSASESSRLPWPVARVNPADAPWPDDDRWWIDNQKFANLAAEWAVNVAAQALESAKALDFKDSDRGGIVVAVSSGEDEGVKVIPRLAAMARNDPRPLATLLFEEVPDYSYVRGIPSQVGQFIAKRSGFLGSNVAVYGEAAAGGLSAAALALRLLDSGELDRVLIVGIGPSIPPAGLALLDRADAIATEAVPGRGPFDRDRHGILLGQGAAAIVIERKDHALRRGADASIELSCCETVCATSLPQAVDAVVELALTQGNGAPPDVWWAHASGSVPLDELETRIVARRLHAMTTSTKGTIGNAFECAGLIDVAVAVEALRLGVVPPVGLLRNPDPALGEVDFVAGCPRKAPNARSALVTAFGHPGSGMTSAGAALITRTTEEQ